jgi:hypothetical protein
VEALFPEVSKYFISQGVLGIMCLVLAWAYWNCRAKVDIAHKERLTDFRATLETISANNVAISDVVEATRSRTEAAVAIAKAQEMLTAEHTRATAEIVRLREALTDTRNEVLRLREELVRRGIA